MAEIRKADITLLLKIKGNKKQKKVEMFSVMQWPEECNKWGRKTYRLRVNGKWFPTGEFRTYYLTQVRNSFWPHVKKQT